MDAVQREREPYLKAQRERARYLKALARRLHDFLAARRTYVGTPEMLAAALQRDGGGMVSADDVIKARTRLLWHNAVPGAALTVTCGRRLRDHYVLRSAVEGEKRAPHRAAANR